MTTEERIQRLREALDAAEDYLRANIPGNEYGLRDHEADKEREEVLAKIAAAKEAK